MYGCLEVAAAFLLSLSHTHIKFKFQGASDLVIKSIKAVRPARFISVIIHKHSLSPFQYKPPLGSHARILTKRARLILSAPGLTLHYFSENISQSGREQKMGHTRPDA